MEFSLYEELAAKASSNSDPIDLTDLTRTVNGLSRLGKESAIPHLNTIYALILHHTHLKGIPISKTVPPLKGVVFEGGRGVTYTFDHNLDPNFDPLLQKIISLYVSSVSTKS